jgi:hypothetical protein
MVSKLNLLVVVAKTAVAKSVFSVVINSWERRLVG